ncbi:MAG: hypothetical protein Kow0080_13680 [Candidatus Promineifilaceae bacterium]
MASIAQNWRQLSLTAEDEALCAYAEKLTQAPSQMSEADVSFLRQVGFDDRAVHDATQVIGYFNYINRIAEPLGVEMEEFVRAWERPFH